MRIAGWVLIGLAALFLISASALPKLLMLDAAIAPMQVVGWPTDYLVLIALIEIACAVLILVPRTALLGGIVTTGLLGASLAANLRVGNPLFSHTLFSLYLGVWIWGGLWLRDPRVRRVFPLLGN